MTSPEMQWRRQSRGVWLFLALPVVAMVCLSLKGARTERQIAALSGWAQHAGPEGGPGPARAVARPARMRSRTKPDRTWQYERALVQGDLHEIASRVDRCTNAVAGWQRALARSGDGGSRAEACAALRERLALLARQRVEVARKLESAEGWEEVDAAAHEVGELWEASRSVDASLRGQLTAGVPRGGEARYQVPGIKPESERWHDRERGDPRDLAN